MSKILLAGVLALLLLPAPRALSSGLTKIPIQIRDNFPLLSASIDGIDVPLKFDLGDGDSLALQQGVLDRIKAVPIGETARFQGVHGVFESPLFKVARVQIGDAVFTDVVARLDIRDATYQPGGQGEKGYLGTGLLKSHQVLIDYPHRMMTLVPRVGNAGQRDHCNGTVVPFLPAWNGEPVTEAETDFGRTILWWDTGSPISIVRKSFVAKTLSDPPGVTIRTERLTMGGTDFGPWQFGTLDVSLPGFDGWLGHDFFAKHVVCVDFPGNRLLIDAAAAAS